jgi:hypothetical protein
MDSPKGRIAVAALALWALAGQAQAQQCSHHQNGNSSFNMQQMANALQPQMSPICGNQSMTGPMMSMSQAQMGRTGSSSCQMSRTPPLQMMTSQMSLMQPMMSSSQLSRVGPFPSMPLQQQPGLQQLQLIAQQQQQLIVQQQLQLQEHKHQDALLKTEQLKNLHLQMTTLRDQLNALQRPSQLDSLQPSALNDLQQRVSTLQGQLNGVSKAPTSLLQQMSELRDQMSSLQQRVTAKPADLIAALRNAAK